MFAGTWLYDNYDFEPHQVLHLDFGKVKSTGDDFEQRLVDYIKDYVLGFGIDFADSQNNIDFILGRTFTRLCSEGNLVVLVDEYEKPLIDNLGDTEVLKSNEDVLRVVFQQLKSYSGEIDKCVVTGVSKLGLSALGSGGNHFNDITLSQRYARMCGYTKAEIELHFGDYLTQAAKAQGVNYEDLWEILAAQYNGYSWFHTDIHNPDFRMYCPFSITKFFEEPSIIGNYWFDTATSKVAVGAVRKQGFNYEDLDKLQATHDDLNTSEPEKYLPVGLLFQTGYLTITEVERAGLQNLYTLSYPNDEVRKAMAKALLFDDVSEQEGYRIARQIYSTITTKNWDEFIKVLNVRLAKDANLRGQNVNERTLNGKIFTALDCSLDTVYNEYQVAGGILDTIIHQKINAIDHTIIIEYKTINENKKYDRSQEALNQIHAKNYAQAFTTAAIVLIGITINVDTKRIEHYKVEEINR